MEICTTMASFLNFFLFFTLILLSDYFTPTNGAFIEHSPPLSSTKPVEKTTHLHFYFHDTITGKNPSAMQVIAPPNGSTGGFGMTFMIDDPLREGPEPSSKIIGRCQGLYTLASQKDFRLLMAFNIVFTEGAYNGSTLAILGHNAIMESVREIPVVGGSGIFRYARGFALLKTNLFRPLSVAIVEYNVTVLHF